MPCLSNLSLCIPAGRLTAVVGEVGSGKSSFLQALMGELEPKEGRLALAPQLQQAAGGAGVIGYVGQSAWVTSGSIRGNVRLGAPYDPQRMRQVRLALHQEGTVLRGHETHVPCKTTEPWLHSIRIHSSQ